MDKKRKDINAQREALQKLIAAKGDCTTLEVGFCKTCPLDECSTRLDGSYMSCIAAAEQILGDGYDLENAFLRLATDMLAQLEIENMLRGPDVED